MFEVWLENKLDNEFRQEAKMIANSIIKAIENDKIEQNSRELFSKSRGGMFTEMIPYEYKIGEFIPNHSNLKIRFVNQAGFGKNQHLGTYGKGVIEIGIPSRTLKSGGNLTYPVEGTTKRFRFPPTVIKWMKKPDVYNTLIHEIVHYLDTKRTKNKVNKNYPYDNVGDDKYFNHPAEYNAFLQAFLVTADKNLTLQQLLELIKKERWFINLNENLKRNVMRRVAHYYESGR